MRHHLVLLVTMILIGCGGRSLTQGGDGGPAAPDATLTGDGAPGVQGDLGLPNSHCMIAIRVDNCCTQPIPALVQHVAQDPCLVPWPIQTIPKECQAKWPEMCQYVDCAYAMPPTRVVGVVPGGGCAWADECADKTDCVLVRDARECCSCLEPYPRSLVQQDVCLVGLQVTPPPSCPVCLDAVLCEPCPPPPSYACVQTDPYNVCQTVYDQ
jgi:hypothetical protein